MCNDDISENQEIEVLSAELPTMCPIYSLEEKIADLSSQKSELASQVQILMKDKNKSFIDEFW